jgi:hypothetical protein
MTERRVVAKTGKEVGDYRHENATRLNIPTAALAREDLAPIPERRFSFDLHLGSAPHVGGEGRPAPRPVDDRVEAVAVEATTHRGLDGASMAAVGEPAHPIGHASGFSTP